VTLILTLLIMAVVAVVAAVAAGRIAGGLDAPASSLPGRGLPEGPLTGPELDRVRFSPALRGYRMDEVDDVLDRLTEELRRRDDEIAWLRARAAGHPQTPYPDEEPTPAAGPAGHGHAEHDVEA
jgi:DivIVA domain-containing protein